MRVVSPPRAGPVLLLAACVLLLSACGGSGSPDAGGRVPADWQQGEEKADRGDGPLRGDGSKDVGPSHSRSGPGDSGSQGGRRSGAVGSDPEERDQVSGAEEPTGSKGPDNERQPSDSTEPPGPAPSQGSDPEAPE